MSLLRWCIHGGRYFYELALPDGGYCRSSLLDTPYSKRTATTFDSFELGRAMGSDPRKCNVRGFLGGWGQMKLDDLGFVDEPLEIRFVTPKAMLYVDELS